MPPAYTWILGHPEDLICGGNDALKGETGKDTLRGGTGADGFDGGSGTDTATDYKATEGDSGTNIP